MNQEQKNTTAFAYIRVSSERQTEGMSLDEQSRQTKLFAENKGLDVVKQFTEVDSASELNRPIFKAMLEEFKKSGIGHIIFHSVDRSARNPYDQAKIYELIQLGHTFHFVAENLSTDNPTARGMILIMWGMASSFTENLKFHVNKGIMGMLGEGRSPNWAPIGYLDKGKGVKEPDPVQSRLVKRAFELYASEQYDIKTLAQKLEEMGLRNKQGNPVHFKVLYKMFRKPFYYGIIMYRGVAYQGSHKPIVKKELFDKVQKALDRRSYKHKTRFAYVFQHLINCPKCDRRLRCISARNRYKYYNCRHKNCEFSGSVSEGKVEAVFLDELRKIEFNDTEVEMFIRAVKQFRGDLRTTNTLQIRQVDMEASKLDQQLDEIMDKYLAKKLDDKEYKQMKMKLMNKRQEFNERKESLSKADEDICNQIEEIGKLLKKPVNAYFLADDEDKKRLVRSLMEKFEWRNENLSVCWKKELKIVSERTKNPIQGNEVVSGSPQLATSRTFSTLLIKLIEYFSTLKKAS